MKTDITQSDWYRQVPTRLVHYHLLNIAVNGEADITIRTLAKSTYLSIQQVRSALQTLCASQIITQKTTQKTTHITLCNCVSYTHSATQKITHKTTLSSDGYNERYTQFCETIERSNASERYPQQMIKEFIFYWTRDTEGDGLMRFERQKSWKLSGRLATWAKNNKVTQKSTKIEEQNNNLLKEYTGNDAYGRCLHFIADEYPNILKILPLPTPQEFLTITNEHRIYIKNVFALLDGDNSYRQYNNFITAFTKALNKYLYATKNTRSATDDHIQHLASGIAATACATSDVALPNDII